jgi:hypothetical protein
VQQVLGQHSETTIAVGEFLLCVATAFLAAIEDARIFKQADTVAEAAPADTITAFLDGLGDLPFVQRETRSVNVGLMVLFAAKRNNNFSSTSIVWQMRSSVCSLGDQRLFR